VTTCGILEYTTIKLCPDDVHISYLPLPHVMERLSITIVVSTGGSIGLKVN
jgi:long-subunit acyl-CoA synthetase (AMP-forming)